MTLDEFENDCGFSEEFLHESELEYERSKLMSLLATTRIENKGLRARVAELEKIVEIITEEHNAQAICAEDFAKTHAENGLFRHQTKELEEQVESMRNCVNCGVSASKCAGNFDWVPITIQGDCMDNGMKHWQPRGNGEGGEL